jgi:hypothetical protein
VIPSKVSEGPKYVLGARTKDPLAPRNYIPGPGQYDTLISSSTKLKAEPSYSIGTGSRADLANLKEHKKKPGPGNYDSFDDSLLKKSAPVYGFGTSKRVDSLEKF